MFTPETHPLNFDTDAADIRVEEQNAAFSRDGEILSTTGLGSCVGIAVYNPTTSEGFLGHFFPSSVEQAIEELPQELTGEDAQAWVAGASYTLPGVPIEATKLTRAKVLDSLSRVGIVGAQVTAVWLDSSEYIGSIQLDTSNGECRIGISEEWGLIPPDDEHF